MLISMLFWLTILWYLFNEIYQVSQISESYIKFAHNIELEDAFIFLFT